VTAEETASAAIRSLKLSMLNPCHAAGLGIVA
jgi:hypothetical protein